MYIIYIAVLITHARETSGDTIVLRMFIQRHEARREGNCVLFHGWDPAGCMARRDNEIKSGRRAQLRPLFAMLLSAQRVENYKTCIKGRRFTVARKLGKKNRALHSRSMI
jgi:hypothetical protein